MKHKILILLIAILLLRGVLNITMTPPLEGFDGIGHIDYLQYLRDHGKRSLDLMPFSRSALELYRLFPTSKHNLNTELGGKSYEDYYHQTDLDTLRKKVWNKKFTPASEYDLSTDNWQKKHPPLYYAVVNFFVSITKPDSFMVGYFLYNLVSLLLLSLSLIAIYGLGKELELIKPGSIKPMLLLFITQPMIYIIACRISNDALAFPLNMLICLAWFKTVKTIRDDYRRRYLLWALLAGILTGIALWTKTFALLFFPAIVLHSIIAFLTTKKRQYLAGSFLVVIVAVAIAAPLLYSNFTISGELDGNSIVRDMQQNGITLDYFQKFKEFYLLSFDGYIQTIKMLVVRLWIGNWSSLANIPIVYLLYIAIFVFAATRLVYKIKSSSVNYRSPYTQFFIFSLLLQLLLLAGLVRLGLQTATSVGRVTAVAGYYSYAFYATELYIFWFLLKDSPRFWPRVVLWTFLIADVCGVFSQLVYYYGAGEVGPGRIVIPHRDCIVEVFRNWHAAPWTIIPLGIWLVLYCIYCITVMFLINHKNMRHHS